MKDNFTENDWKLFRNKIIIWQEKYMERLINKYINLLNENIDSSEKFWKLEKQINQDKKHPGVNIEMKRSVLIPNLAMLILNGVIEFSELNDFSGGLKESVERFLKSYS